VKGEPEEGHTGNPLEWYVAQKEIAVIGEEISKL
jgi:hypothetical protein